MVVFSPHGGLYPITVLVNYDAYINGFATLIKLRGGPLLVTRRLESLVLTKSWRL